MISEEFAVNLPIHVPEKTLTENPNFYKLLKKLEGVLAENGMTKTTVEKVEQATKESRPVLRKNKELKVMTQDLLMDAVNKRELSSKSENAVTRAVLLSEFPQNADEHMGLSVKELTASIQSDQDEVKKELEKVLNLKIKRIHAEISERLSSSYLDLKISSEFKEKIEEYEQLRKDVQDLKEHQLNCMGKIQDRSAQCLSLIDSITYMKERGSIPMVERLEGDYGVLSLKVMELKVEIMIRELEEATYTPDVIEATKKIIAQLKEENHRMKSEYFKKNHDLEEYKKLGEEINELVKQYNGINDRKEVIKYGVSKEKHQ